MGYCFEDFSKKMAAREFIDTSFKAFAALRKTPNGTSIIRRRKGQFAKKLVEEILPISAFLGYFERPGLELYCQFYSGNQKYDARIYCEGWFVENDYLKEEYFLEVSTVCDQVDYLRRECIDKGQPFFGGPARRLANGEIESTPKSFSPEIIVEDNLSNIRSTLSKKARKGYPENTFLIIPLVPTVLLWPGEWLDVLKKLQSVNLPFCGVFVYDSVSQRKALL